MTFTTMILSDGVWSTYESCGIAADAYSIFSRIEAEAKEQQT